MPTMNNPAPSPVAAQSEPETPPRKTGTLHPVPQSSPDLFSKPDANQAALTGTAQKSPMVDIPMYNSPEEKTQKPVYAASQKKPLDLSSITSDVLELALKITSGEIKTMAITGDMVGSTLIYDGDVRVVGSVAQTTTPVEPNTPARQVQSVADEVSDYSFNLRDKDLKLVEIIKTISDDFISLPDVATLAWEDMGYASRRSAVCSIGKVFKKLEKNGLIHIKKITSPGGREQVFVKAA